MMRSGESRGRWLRSGAIASMMVCGALLGTSARAAASLPPPEVFSGLPDQPLGEVAIIRASVNPEGSTITDCHLEVGVSTSYGQSIACPQSIGSGEVPVAVAVEVGGLLPETLYHYRLLATNEGGTSPGDDATFKTPSALPPSAATSPPTNITQSVATLEAYVSANGWSVEDCHFEYGTSPALGATVPCAQSVATRWEQVAVSATITGLQPGTTYYYRVVAGNVGGSSGGITEVFTTMSLPVAPIPQSPFVPYHPGGYVGEVKEGSSPTPFLSRGRCAALTGAARTRCLRPPARGYQPMPSDIGLYVHYCPAHAASLRASAAGTSEAGWPKDECLKMDKGSAGRHHKLVGLRSVHNWLLGGYGSDTIIGGNIGDVIWADYHPSGAPKHQTATIHAGNGRNVIYANDTVNYVWTGTNPKTLVHAHNPGTGGVIHCQSPGVVVFLSTVSERSFKLDGCRHISHFSVGY